MNEKRFYELNKIAELFFMECLQSAEALLAKKYVRDRQMDDRTITRFGIGYAPEKGKALLRHLKKQGCSYEEALEAGLASRNESGKYFDRFRNRIMLPIINKDGNIIGFGGRVIGDTKPKYLNSPDSVFFQKREHLYGENLSQNSRYRSRILCEGYFDVISMHKCGINNAVASLGTAFTEGHAKQLRETTDWVCIAYDSDEAGMSAAARVIPMLRKHGILVRVLNVNPCKDPDEFAKTFGAYALMERLRDAEKETDFFLRYLKSQCNLNDIDDRIRYQKEAVEAICKFTRKEEREKYYRELSMLFEVPVSAYRELESKSQAENGREGTKC